MRWFVLYARSRQVPASLAVMVAGAALVRWLSGGGADPRMAALALVAGVAAASVGLGGQDVRLDRTAAVRWVPRRAAHLLLAGALAGAVLVAFQAAGGEAAPAGFVVRDCAGLLGLAGLGAALFGGQFAWTLPVGWFCVAFFIPPGTDVPTLVATWMLAPPDTPAATWTALALAAAGTAGYALAGPRR
ncbi:hypothetical protein [Nonomuraea sp. SBT364]|uniref:hypothetical protein n=1 Tax=Nonomuraea sp. SBT364 TaxID=1580530 RepID=UPI00066BF5E4|nr:hypothetical protein [Nonomuraea sp. SBT364]